MPRPRKTNFHLPPYVVVSHGAYWYRPSKGRSIRLAALNHFDEAMQKYTLLSGGGRVMDPKEIPALLGKVKKNAEPRGLAVNLSHSDILALWERSQGKCELTGIPFETAPFRSHRKRPWTPSVDRIDSRYGYEIGNVRLVCTAMNYALNEWGEDVFRRLAVGYIKTRPKPSKIESIDSLKSSNTVFEVPAELVRSFGLDPRRPLSEYFECKEPVALLRLEEILPPDLSDKTRGLDIRRLRTILFKIKQRSELAPIVVTHAPGAQRAILVDGAHRYSASRAVGFSKIPVKVVSMEEAISQYKFKLA